MTLNESMRWALCALFSLALAGCGGGTSVASTGGGVGTGGTGIALGTVTGFGSVVVDGTAYSSATPTYFAGTEAEEAAPASSAAVELGDQLQIALDANGNPSTVVIESELKGAGGNLLPPANPGFTVNGVAVRVNADPAVGPVTYYAGLVGYSGLATAMQVEVHGVYGVDANGQGYILATLIEQLPSTNPVTRITGQVANLVTHPDGSASFDIGGVSVRYAAAASVLPAGTGLANGQLVNAWSNTAGAPGVISASVIRIRTLQGVAGPVQISGLVAGLTGSGFQLSGIPVDASAAGPAAVLPTLVAGQYVVVQGQATAATGVVVASKIQVYTAQPAPVALHGTITGFVSAANFLVRGVSVDATTAVFSPAGTTAASLANGVFVDLTGMVSGNKVTAAAVTVQGTPPGGRTVDYQGVVGQCATAGCGSFVLTLQDGTVRNVTLASNVAYSNGSAAQLINNASVEVEATTSNTTATDLLAYSVSFQGLPSPATGGDGTTLETNGLAYDVNLSATPPTFAVNGLTIQINGVSVTPAGATLANGAKVEVDFVQSGANNLAKAIGIDH
ncbi:MAG: hypothetical protein KGI87_04355 [Burkholderiales bacterium]|nr:hypothetical protein [Burkholderiales bacterium]